MGIPYKGDLNVYKMESNVKIYVVMHYFYHNANIFFTNKIDAEEKVKELIEQTGSSLYEWYIMELEEGKRFDLVNKWKEF